MSTSTTSLNTAALAAEWATHSYRYLDQRISPDSAFDGISTMYANARTMPARERQAFWAKTCELLGERLGIKMPSRLSSMSMTPHQVEYLSQELSRLVHASASRRSHPATVLLLATMPISASFTDFEKRRLKSMRRSPTVDVTAIRNDLRITFARWR